MIKTLKSSLVYLLAFAVLAVMSVQKNLVAQMMTEHAKNYRAFVQKLQKVSRAKSISGKTLERKYLKMVDDGNVFIVRFDSNQLSSDRWESTLENIGATPLKTLATVDAVVVFADSAKVIKDIQKLAGVRSVDPERKIESFLCDDSDACAPITKQPKDDMQWNIKVTNAPAVWAAGTGCGVKVCVVDSGVDRSHPDLSSRVSGGKNFVPEDPAGGADEKEPEKDVGDLLGHGTHVSGIIAGSVNGMGITGMAPGAKLYLARVFGSSPYTTTSTIIEGVAYCNEIGADVINMSLGGGYPDASMEAEIQKALDRGAVVAVAAGNLGTGVPYNPDSPADIVTFPGNMPGVLTVSASDENNDFAGFSSEGPMVDIMAPGSTSFTWDTDPNTPGNQWYNKGIFSSLAGFALLEYETPSFEGDNEQIDGKRRFGRMSGTSMAAPHVAGAAALLKSLYPNRSGAEIVDALKSGATNLGLPSNRQGAGLLNVEAALNILDAGN